MNLKKISKYGDLEIEMPKMQQLKTKTILVVVDVLGMIRKGSNIHYYEIF